MEVWFQIIFLSQTRDFAGIPCVKLPKAFFFTYHPPPMIPRPAILGDLRPPSVASLRPIQHWSRWRTWPNLDDVFNEDVSMPLAGCKKLEKKNTEIQMGCCVCQKWTTIGVYQFIMYIMVGISESKSFILAQTAKKKGQSQILWL